MDCAIELAPTTETKVDDTQEAYMEFYTDDPQPVSANKEVNVQHEQGPLTGHQYAQVVPKGDRPRATPKKGERTRLATYQSTSSKKSRKSGKRPRAWLSAELLALWR